MPDTPPSPTSQNQPTTSPDPTAPAPNTTDDQQLPSAPQPPIVENSLEPSPISAPTPPAESSPPPSATEVAVSSTPTPPETVPPIDTSNSPPSVSTAFAPPPTDLSPGTPPEPPPPENSLKPARIDHIKRSPFRFLLPIIGAIFILGIIGLVVTKIILPRLRPTTPAEVTLTYWGLWEDQSTLEPVFSKFTSAHPGVTINYVQQSPKDYRERLQSAIVRNEGPDLFRFHNTWVPMYKDIVGPIPESIMSSSQFESTFYPVAHKDLKLNGKYIGIPLEIDGLALYYNKKIFSAAGKTPPTTWQEARRVANELTLKDADGKIIRAGIAMGTTGNVDHWPDILGLMMLQNGANPAAPTDQLAEDSLAFYTIFTREDKIWDDTLPSSTVAFATEKATMMIAPSWRAFEVKSLNPDLDFATAPVPKLPNTITSWASYWVEGVSAKISSEKKDLAWQLVKFMSEKEQLRQFYTTASSTRLFGEPYSRVDMADEVASDPIVGAFITDARSAQSWYLASHTKDNGVNDRIIQYYADAINAVNEGRSIRQSLDTATEGVTQVLSQYAVSGAFK